MLTKDDVINGIKEYSWSTEYPLYNDKEVYNNFLKHQLDNTGISIIDYDIPFLYIDDKNILFEVVRLNNNKHNHSVSIVLY